jgi:hypothetical protein
MQYLQRLIEPSGNDPMLKYFHVDDFGGINQLRGYLKLLPNRTGFADDSNTVKSITIIRDAEGSAAAAIQSVCGALGDSNFAVPASPCEIAIPSNGQHMVSVAYALFPAFNSASINGTLEDLCLSTLKHPSKDMILDIARNAVSSAVEQVCCEFSREHKNKLHTYLSLTNEYVGLKIGESAKANAFDFSTSSLEPLKDLLEKICKL